MRTIHGMSMATLSVPIAKSLLALEYQRKDCPVSSATFAAPATPTQSFHLLLSMGQPVSPINHKKHVGEEPPPTGEPAPYVSNPLCEAGTDVLIMGSVFPLFRYL